MPLKYVWRVRHCRTSWWPRNSENQVQTGSFASTRSDNQQATGLSSSSFQLDCPALQFFSSRLSSSRSGPVLGPFSTVQFSVQFSIKTAKLNRVEPYAWLRNTLEKMDGGHAMSQFDELLPWRAKIVGAEAS